MNIKTIKWGEPRESNQSGIWRVLIEDLSHRTINEVYRHELCKGNFVFPPPSTGKADVQLSQRMVEEYGAIRCWWLLREDICEVVPHVSRLMECAIDEALSTPNIHQRDDDGLSIYGEF